MSQSFKHPVNSPSFSSSLLDKVLYSVDKFNETTATHATLSTSSDRFAAHQSTPERKNKKIDPNRRKIDADKPERHRSSDFKLNPSRGGPNRPNGCMIGVMNLKPIRTSTERSGYNHPDRDSASCKMNREGYRNGSSKPAKHETASAPPSIISLQNAKIRAQKIDLKDVKQPISPGGSRLTRFITSLFTKRNSSNKGEKVRETEVVRTRHEPVTTCSSATSYYRSCLSSKPIGASKITSVRFCPVSNIIDDERRRRDNPRLVPFRQKSEVDRIKQRQAESNLKELLKKYNRNEVLMSVNDGKLSDEEKHDDIIDDDDDDDDGGSCSSSDLFELDHIGGTVNHSISINDELPVYETTKFHSKNPAIW